MQNPTTIKRTPQAAIARRELSWSFTFLVILCACVVALGFFFAARQHFTSMDYGLKNSKLREQLQNLETEKRRLMLAREIALSPLAIRKAARNVGLRETADIEAVAASTKTTEKTAGTAIRVKATHGSEAPNAAPAVMRTTMSTPVESKPVQSKPTGETRSRVVEAKKTEVAALLKLK